jgi:hypothetical protein
LLGLKARRARDPELRLVAWDATELAALAATTFLLKREGMLVKEYRTFREIKKKELTNAGWSTT